MRMTWPQRMALAVYGWLMQALVPLMLARLRRRGRDEPLYLQHVGQRLGRYASSPQHADWFWVHAVSLGETRAAALLIEQLRAARPGIRILLTHGTATGWAQGQPLLQPGDAQAWLPWDTPGATRRFLEHFRPLVGVLLETEVWPHLVHQCARRSIPLCLVNARMNERSMRRARRLAWLAGPAYAALAAIHAQSSQDARRLKLVGARVDGVWGNLKFDVAPDDQQRAVARRWRDAMASHGPLVMLASSREGEEQLWLQAWLALRERAPHVRWLIVPRHPQRFDPVYRLLADAGLAVARRVDWDDAHDAAGLGALARRARIWLGDSVGEMQLYYSLSDAALLGGSFLPLGGQNLIEALSCGCPVIAGPYTFNFAQAADAAIRAGAAWRCADMDEAVRQVLQLLSPGEDPALPDGTALLRAAGSRHAPALDAARGAGLRLVEEGRGAALSYAQAVLDLAWLRASQLPGARPAPRPLR